MDITENSASDRSPNVRNKTQTIVKWMVSVILLCVLALGIAIWWPAHQAYRLVDYAKENNGKVSFAHNHPLWMEDIIDHQTYLPWYDEAYSFTAPASDDVLQSLHWLRGLKHASLDISECSPECLNHLESCIQLKSVHLTGNQKPISFDWVEDCKNLTSLSVTDIPIPPAQWSKLMASPNFSAIQISDNRISFNDVPENSILIDQQHLKNHLGRADAEAINSTAGLQSLSLNVTATDEEFWKTLGNNQTLTEINISGRVLLADLVQLGKIPTLKDLQLWPVPISTEDWRILPQIRELRTLVVDISACSPESFKYVPMCETLQNLHLTGTNKPIPLDWLKSCANLNNVSFTDIPVPPEKWPELLALPSFKSINIDGNSNTTWISSSSGPPPLTRITIDGIPVGLAEAEAINRTADLEGLSLYHATSNAEFWETLEQNQTLCQIEVSGPLPPTAPLHLAKIPTLKTLVLSHPPMPVPANENNVSPAWQTFLELRSDVEIQQQ